MYITKDGQDYQVNIDAGGLLGIRQELINNCSTIINGTTVTVFLTDPQESSLNLPKERGEVLSVTYHLLAPSHIRQNGEAAPCYYCDWEYQVHTPAANLIEDAIMKLDEEALIKLIELTKVNPDDKRLKTPEEESFYYEDIRSFVSLSPVSKETQSNRQPIYIRSRIHRNDTETGRK